MPTVNEASAYVFHVLPHKCCCVLLEISRVCFWFSPLGTILCEPLRCLRQCENPTRLLWKNTPACSLFGTNSHVQSHFNPPVFLILRLIFLPTCPTSWCCLIASQAVVTSSLKFSLIKWLVRVHCIPHCRDFSQARQSEPACLQWTHKAKPDKDPPRNRVYAFVFVCVCLCAMSTAQQQSGRL